MAFDVNPNLRIVCRAERAMPPVRYSADGSPGVDEWMDEWMDDDADDDTIKIDADLCNGSTNSTLIVTTLALTRVMQVPVHVMQEFLPYL